MRNLFDQYSQSENRLTHAMASCLNEDRKLLREFVQWITERPVAAGSKLCIYEQHVPGEPVLDSESDIERRGLPDLWIDDETNHPLLIECKVQARVDNDQLLRHCATARRNGFEPRLVVIAPDRPPTELPRGIGLRTWPEVYSWFRMHVAGSDWARKLVEYMHILEARMTADESLNGAALTRFDGVPFDREHPYTYLEAKRVLRQLMDELTKRHDLSRAGIDTRTKRRVAITGSQAKDVWDYLAPRRVRGASEFTTFPHFVVSIHTTAVHANIVIPNGIRGGLRRRLAELGEESFAEMIAALAIRLEETALRGSSGAYPHAYIVQRRFLSRKGPVVEDAKLEFDMRTVADAAGVGVGRQPEWARMMFHAIANKQSNLQFGFGAVFPHESGSLRDAASAVHRIAATWVASAPVVDVLTPALGN